MLTTGSSGEHVREYLHCLGSEKQAALLEAVERAVLLGENIEDADVILGELRRVIRNSPVTTERVGSPSRQFFNPIEPFMVGGPPSVVARGQIARASLGPIWIWICHSLLPKEAKSYSEAVSRALGVSDTNTANGQAEAFYAVALPSIRKALASKEGRDRVHDFLAAHMGPPRAMIDLREIVSVLAIRHSLASLGGKLPEHIGTLVGESLAIVRRALDEVEADCGDTFIYALLLVMRRLFEPWQLVRLVVPTGNGDALATPYRFAILLVIANTENMVSALSAALKSDETETTGELIQAISRTLNGLGSELNLSGNPWALQKVAAIRDSVHSLLAAEVEGVPANIKRFFETTAPLETTQGSQADADFATTEQKIALVQFVRPFAAVLALGAQVAAALSGVRSKIEWGMVALFSGLRNASDSARLFYSLRITHAVQICLRLFGKEYASAMITATEAAIDDHPLQATERMANAR
jgi:hypothetical protein